MRYGTDREILSDLSFTLHAGRFYFLTGGSGAGKTTLLKMLYLAQRPVRGSLQLFGRDTAMLARDEIAMLRRRIGVVFQDFRLVPQLSAWDNVALPLRLSGIAERELAAPVTEMLEWVGLSGKLHARPATLSGGEQQRVAIARAVIGRPRLLIADEPTGNVDRNLAVKLLHLFEALNAQGTAVIVATHDYDLLRRVPRAEILRIERGRLSDPTGALRHPPRSGR